LLNAQVEGAVAGDYIVVMEDAIPSATVDSVAAQATADGGTVTQRYGSAVTGFAATLPVEALAAVRSASGVAYVEPDTVATTVATAGADGTDDVQPGPPWGLDRIDQRKIRYDDEYRWKRDGTGVNVYVISTGIRFSHEEFEGRAITGPDFYQPDEDSSDCTGDGTSFASVIGGRTYGVAKGATLVALRVTNCDGEGTASDTLAAIDWVTANAEDRGVISLNQQFSPSEALNDAVAAAYAAGIPSTVPAGNFEQDSCVLSPQQEPTAITVAATDFDDTEAFFSSHGECVDIYAPGVDITTAWTGSDTATALYTATEPAAAHVAGALAKLIEKFPAATAEELTDTLIDRSTKDKLTDLGPGSPNQLLFSRKH